MASISVADDLILLQLTAAERFWARQERIVVPLSAVRQVAVVAQPLRMTRGGRRGVVVSGFLKVGVWGALYGPRQFVSVRRGEPGLHLVLDRAASGGQFDEIVLSDPSAPAIAATIELERPLR